MDRRTPLQRGGSYKRFLNFLQVRLPTALQNIDDVGNAERSILSVSAAVVTTIIHTRLKPRQPRLRRSGCLPPCAGCGSGTVAAIALPPEFVIGPNDTLSVLFWRGKDMSADVVVRPDGTSPSAVERHPGAGLTPDQLREGFSGGTPIHRGRVRRSW